MATIKKFKGVTPPVLKNGEIATNGKFLFLGLEDGDYLVFVGANKAALQIEGSSDDTVMEIGTGSYPNKFNALDVYADGTLVATACSKMDIDGFHLNHPKDHQRNSNKSKRVLVTKEWVEEYVTANFEPKAV